MTLDAEIVLTEHLDKSLLTYRAALRAVAEARQAQEDAEREVERTNTAMREAEQQCEAAHQALIEASLEGEGK